MTKRFFALFKTAAAAAALFAGSALSVSIDPSVGAGPSRGVSVGVAGAEAHPWGVARRTARRVTRRTIAGCAYYAPYYRCGGVYYRPVVQHGRLVYVSVNGAVVVRY